MLFSKHYDSHFFVRSKDLKNNFAKTYVCQNKQQTDFFSLILVAGDISIFLNSGFIVLRKFKDKYLVYNDFALQNRTFEKIIYKYWQSGEKIKV